MERVALRLGGGRVSGRGCYGRWAGAVGVSSAVGFDELVLAEGAAAGLLCPPTHARTRACQTKLTVLQYTLSSTERESKIQIQSMPPCLSLVPHIHR